MPPCSTRGVSECNTKLANQHGQKSLPQNGNTTQNRGMTSAISTAGPKSGDIQATNDLEKSLKQFNVFESDHELNHRLEILSKLNSLVHAFIEDLSIQQNIPIEAASKLGGHIQTFGSYRLGVHSPGADIDALCIAPRNVPREKFFTLFTELLKKQSEVTECRAIEEAFVPVVKMNFDGIEIDLLFARLAFKKIPDDFDMSDDMILKNLDQKCVRSLNGCRVTDEILHCVPNIENYRLALRAIKLWAKRRGIYSNAMGFFGGVSWAMLVARTCQLYPNAVAATIVSKFFLVFSRWQWPSPILLRPPHDANLGYQVWDPRINAADRYHQMPVITPAYPQQNSTFNVSKSTKQIIQAEFMRGHQIVEEIMIGKATWPKLFEQPNFFHNYRHFLVVLVGSKTAEDQLEWCGLVEAKVRHLVGNLEHNEHINLAHVNPKRFECSRQHIKTAEVCSMWFVGMEFKQMKNLNIDLTENIQNFTNLVYKHSFALRKTGMQIEVRHLRRNELSTYLEKNILNPIIDVTKPITKTTSSIIAAKSGNKKRMSTETTAQLQRSESDQMMKRQKIN